MKDLNKAQAYKELIEKVKTDYKQRQINPKVGLIWCDDCQEINLWTYWQGLGYAEKTPCIKLMVVGQDFGPCEGTNCPGNNIYQINHSIGEPSQYLEGLPNKKIAITDRNLITLFKKVLRIDISKERPGDLFFTNFSLGYRTGNGSGGMTLGMMMKDADYFKDLCEIVRPEEIICLGRITYEAVVKTLKGQKPKIKVYSKYIADRNFETYSDGDYTCNIYPSAHTGSLGVLNRNRNNGNIKEPLKTVEEDWKSYLNK